MYFGKDPKNMKMMVGSMIDKLLYLQNPQEKCPYMPDTVHIEPIGICNLDCIHCTREVITRELGTMTFDQFKTIIDKVSPYKCNISIGRNGEPFLNKRLIDMIKYVKEKGLFCSLITNATPMYEKQRTGVIKSGLDRIVFSFDSVDKEVYEAIRKKAKFDKTLGNILLFLKENYEAGMPVNTAVSWTTTKMAKESPTNIEEYFSSFPINGVYPSPLLNMFGDTKVNDEFPDNPNQNKPTSEWPICTNGWDRLGIQWNGTVVACVVDFDDRYVIGNLFEQELEEIWNGSEMRAFRRALMSKRYETVEKNGPLCSKCSVKWEPGFDTGKIAETTKNNIFNEIHSREFQVIHDEKTRYEKLMVELKRLGWLDE